MAKSQRVCPGDACSVPIPHRVRVPLESMMGAALHPVPPVAALYKTNAR